MIIIWIVCKISSVRSFLTYLWSTVRKLWSWETKVIVSSFKQIMKLSWIFHVRMIWMQEQERASIAKSMSFEKQRRRRWWEKEKEKKIQNRKKNFEKQERTCLLDDRMWMIRSSSNRKTLKSSDSQWCRGKIDRSVWCYQVLRDFFWISQWSRYDMKLMMILSEEKRII